MILLLICFILDILVISSVALKSQLEDAFSDPNWMGFEDREDEGYKWSDNITNYMEEL